MLNSWLAWTGLIVALGSIASGTFLVAKRLMRVVSALVHFSDAVPTLIAIADQFQPNHGSTLRDAVDRIEARQAEDGAALTALKQRVEPLLVAQGR